MVVYWVFLVVLWDFTRIYPLVNVYMTMDNHHGEVKYQWQIFNSYVCLPESKSLHE